MTSYNVTTLEKLCNILDIDIEVKVYFWDVDEDTQKIIGAVCTPDEIANDIEAGRYDPSKKYDKSSIGIYIPKINTLKFFDMQYHNNKYGVLKIVEKICPGINVPKEKRALYYSVFCILHELGHIKYYDYCATVEGLSDEQFYCKDIDERRPVELFANKINEVHIGAEKDILLQRLNNMYHNNISSEYAADFFANKYFERAMAYIKKELEIMD